MQLTTEQTKEVKRFYDFLQTLDDTDLVRESIHMLNTCDYCGRMGSFNDYVECYCMRDD